jgi:hypothetical protein
MVATAGYAGFKQIRAIICAEPLHTNNSSIGLAAVPKNQYEATPWHVGFKQIRAIICAEPLHNQQ